MVFSFDTGYLSGKWYTGTVCKMSMRGEHLGTRGLDVTVGSR